jgi:multiple sugar transport system substrate-binding protein
MQMKKSGFTLLAVLMVMTTVLAACSGGSPSGDGTYTPDTRVLRIGILSGDSSNEYVRGQYTDSFEMLQRGEVKVEVVPATNYTDNYYAPPEEDSDTSYYNNGKQYERLLTLLDGEAPVDVVLLENGELPLLRQLVRDNKLKQLDPLIADNNFDLSDFSSTVLEGMRDAGDGNLYALAPSFTTSALFYNRAIFQEQGIQPPTDQMTWEEVLSLAKQVTHGEGKDRVYGFSASRYSEWDPSFAIDMMAAQSKLKLYDDQGENMTINTPQWEKIFTEAYSLYEENVWPTQAVIYGEDQDYNSYDKGDFFMSGRLAMTLSNFGYVSELEQYARGAESNALLTPLDWDVVTVPVQPEAMDTGVGTAFTGLVAINAKALNPSDAWNYVSFLNGPEWAKLKSRSTGGLMSRLSAQDLTNATYHREAFNLLRPLPPTGDMTFDDTHPGIYNVNSLAYGIFDQIKAGDFSLQEGIAEWEKQGNDILRRIKEDPQNWEEQYWNEQYGDDGVSVSPAPVY